MLLTGLHPEPLVDGVDAHMATGDDDGGTDDSFAPQRAACTFLGEAMMALLPGIDANDQDKSMATISFYLAVLSNCVAFTGVDQPAEEGTGVLQLGFCAEDFVIGFLQRLFGVIGDLEVTAGSADGTTGSDGCVVRFECCSTRHCRFCITHALR